jgi:hypothetical protein
MPDAAGIARGILAELGAVGNPRRAELMAAEYTTTKLVHLGCTMPDVRRVARAHARMQRPEPALGVDPGAAERFLAGHVAGLAARVQREVRTKLTTGTKNATRRRAT